MQKGKFNKFFWSAPGYGLTEIVDSKFDAHPFFRDGSIGARNLQQLIANELGTSTRESAGEAAKHIEYMRKHDLVDYCEASEKGHMKWYPKGLLQLQLLVEYGRRLARDWGAFEMKNPMLIRGDQNTVGELMGEFHERDYKVDGGRGIGFLRYASDPLGFPFMQRVRFNEHQSPLKVYEEANCFRNEQDGEVSGLKRMRWFIMTDMHAACSSEAQAWLEYDALTTRFGKLMDDIIAPKRWVLGWEVVSEYFEKYGKHLQTLSDSSDAPALFKLTPTMSHYYAFKNEFQALTADNSNVQVSTVQWDVKNGPRFDIGYTNSTGTKTPCPVIIHASSIGSVERALCGILETIAVDEKEGRSPQFPLWLAPSQARIVPVSPDQLEYAFGLANELNRLNIRTDVEDRNVTVGKGIRSAEKDWVPYTVVVGARETQGSLLSVRVRGSKELFETDASGLAKAIHDKTGDLPYLPLPLPVAMSKRPLFK